MNDLTTIICLTCNSERKINEVYQKLNNHLKQHHNVERIIYADLNSKDLTLTLLSLLINKDANLKNIIIRHKKKISIGGAINNCHRITTSNNIIIIEADPRTQLRKISKEIKMLHKAHIIIPHKKDTLNIAYRKEFIRFKPNNHIRQQIIMIAKKQNLRISKIEN
jgi:glycosyltransferase involved in cell wall biosynthesis